MEQQQNSLGTADIAKIMATMPHRYPFLMIDRLREIRGDESCIGVKNVTINEPHFVGHFPSMPIFPGVLLLEGMAQTAGALCVMAQGGQAAKLVYLMTIDNAKFRKPVVPGDVVEYHVRKIKRRANIWKFAAEAKVDGVKVAEAEVSAMLAEA